jgi:hypothetical protein
LRAALPRHRFHFAAQGRDKTRRVARQRDILAVRDISLEHGRFGNIDCSQSRPLVGSQGELVNNGNAETVRDRAQTVDPKRARIVTS